MSDKEYTLIDMHSAWVAGYRNAEYRFRLLPDPLLGSTPEVKKLIDEAVERGDNRTFSRWLSDYEDQQERRARVGFEMPHESVRVIKLQRDESSWHDD